METGTYVPNSTRLDPEEISLDKVLCYILICFQGFVVRDTSRPPLRCSARRGDETSQGFCLLDVQSRFPNLFFQNRTDEMKEIVKKIEQYSS